MRRKRQKMSLDMQYFENLQGKINLRLIELVKQGKYDKEMAKRQIEQVPWLYGALGEVPSDVMFICENPSIAGINKAHVNTIDGGRPDIEAQWWGGAARSFREALYLLKLKTTRPRERNGWHCYITNVIKQSNIAKDQELLPPVDKRQQARDWAYILQWEFDHVKPKFVFCVGGSSFKYVQMLQIEGLLDQFPIFELMHYSAHGLTTQVINKAIVTGVRSVMTSPNVPKEDIKPRADPVQFIRNSGEILSGGKMKDWYSEIKKIDGRKCFTLTRDKPAIMHVDDNGVTIEYPTGGTTRISRTLFDEAFRKLQIKGMLTLEDVHNDITNRNGPKTDRLMAVLRELPGVGFTGDPRTLFIKK
jgi:hypothetical protein